MSIIYINARFLTQPMSGVQRFAAEISLKLAKLRNDIIFLAPKNILHKNIASQLPLKTFGMNKGTLWEQIDLPFFLKKNKNPLLICLANTAPILYTNYIVCHHDITYIKYPETLSRKAKFWYSFLMPKVIKNAKKICTVSEFSKKDISHHYNVNANNIDVIYNAVADIFLKHEGKSNKSEKYALLVSSVNPHKNVNFVLQALIKSSLKVKLKVVGGKASTFSDVALPKSKRVEYIGRVSDEELITLYDNAAIFIFPSLYEGFGIPPLEAQARGCAVISSNAASMPEVLGNSVVYFSPFDECDFINKFAMMIGDAPWCSELVEKGYENIKRFSWQKSAERLSFILDEFNY